MVTPSTTREVLYVCASRGRESNRLYVDTVYDPDPATGHDGATPVQTARGVLAGVLANEGADLSAHESLRRAHAQAEDFATLAAEYGTLARAAQEQRWEALLERSALRPGQLEQVRRSDAYGPLLTAFRDAEARGLDVETAFPKLVAVRSLDDAEDPAAVMHERVDRWAQTAASKRQAATNLIAGLIPRAAGVADADMSRALEERDRAMQRRARKLAERAVERGQVWVSRLGAPPADPGRREQWIEAISTVAAYRDRWSIGNDHRPVGPDSAVRTIEAVVHRTRAAAAVKRALRLTRQAAPEAPEAAGVAAATTRTGEVEL
jgi:hypothetical protein